MASGIVKRQGNRFDAVYEQPWGGVASNTDPADIPPSCNTFCDGIFIKNGRLCTAGWDVSHAVNYSTTAGLNRFAGEEILFYRTILTSAGGYFLCAFSNFGRVYIYNLTTNVFVLDQTMTPSPPGGTMKIYDIQVIAGVAYVSLFDAGMIYAYTPGVSYVQATAYVGGKYLTEIIGYLVTANTNLQGPPPDVPPIKFNRYNWSVPFSYVDNLAGVPPPPTSAWNPAINRLAGFNTISEVQDEITRIFALGNVAYVLRDQGISQLSPTGQALAPFAVTPLWESQFGIGCTYPESFAQYGAVAVWANDNDIYAFFNGSVPQAITGSAKPAIYADINATEGIAEEFTIVSGAFFNCSENSKIPELTYVLSIVSGVGVGGGGTKLTGIFWTYNFASKTWTRQVVDLLALLRLLFGVPTFIFETIGAKVQGILYLQSVDVGTPISAKRIIGGLALVVLPDNGSGIEFSFLFPFFNSDTGQPVLGGGDISTACDFQFRQEELRLGTQPTIRGVLVKAAGSGQLNVSVNGTVFTPITVNSTTAKTYRSSGVYSGENPQLNVFGTNFSGVVIKANMLITYEEGEPL